MAKKTTKKKFVITKKKFPLIKKKTIGSGTRTVWVITKKIKG